jgi:hypothetical protein
MNETDSDLERLGDEIAELSAHLHAATGPGPGSGPLVAHSGACATGMARLFHGAGEGGAGSLELARKWCGLWVLHAAWR